MIDTAASSVAGMMVSGQVLLARRFDVLAADVVESEQIFDGRRRSGGRRCGRGQRKTLDGGHQDETQGQRDHEPIHNFCVDPFCDLER